MRRAWLDSRSYKVEIDFLRPERQGDSPIVRINAAETENAAIERCGRLDVGDGEHQVIKTLDDEAGHPAPLPRRVGLNRSEDAVTEFLPGATPAFRTAPATSSATIFGAFASKIERESRQRVQLAVPS